MTLFLHPLSRNLFPGYQTMLKQKTTLLLLILIFLSGCAGNKATKQKSPQLLYQDAVALYYNKRYPEAIEKFKELIDKHPVGKYSIDSELLIADSYYYHGEYDEAYDSYTSFASLHPTHPKTPYALFQKGMSSYNQINSIDRDQENTRQALFTFETLQKSFPQTSYAKKADELIAFCRKRLAEREFYIGSFYFKKKNYTGALARFKKILEEYPDSDIIDKVLFHIGMSYIRLENKELAREAFVNLISRFPESRYTEEAKKNLKTI